MSKRGGLATPTTSEDNAKPTARKRKRLSARAVRPGVTRIRNRQEASKEQLLEALEDIDTYFQSSQEEADRQRLHDSGAHRFIVDYNCQGEDPELYCFVECGMCRDDECPSQNTRLDPEKYGVVCFDCVDQAHDFVDRMKTYPA
jgi:hypothetical protein